MRSALLNWILKNKDSLEKCDCQSFVVPLVTTMQDKGKEIREMAEQVVKVILKYVGYGTFATAIQDLKPMVKISLESILDKYKPIVNTKMEEEDKNENDNIEINLEEIKLDKSTKPNEEEKDDNLIDKVDITTKEQKVKSPEIPINNELKIKQEDVIKVDEEKTDANKDIKKNITEKLILNNPEVGFLHEIVEEEHKDCFQIDSDKKPVNENSELRLPLTSTKSLINPCKLTNLYDNQINTSVSLALDASGLKIPVSPSKSATKKPPIEMSTSRSTNDLQKRFESRRIAKAREAKKISRKINRTSVKLTSQSPCRSGSTFSSETLIIATIGNKEKRAEADKGLKWPINEIRED